MKKFSILKDQEGAVLVVGLILLLVITLIGMSGIRSATIETKMAGNQKNRHLAFESAESALREAESYVESITATGAFNGSNGLLGLFDNDVDYFADSTWNSNSVTAKAGSVAYVESQPRYIIKQKVLLQSNMGSLNVGRYGAHNMMQVRVFQITSRGTGGNDSAKVILQTHYGKIL